MLMNNVCFSYKINSTGFVFVLNALCIWVLRSLLGIKRGIKIKYIISFWVRHRRH